MPLVNLSSVRNALRPGLARVSVTSHPGPVFDVGDVVQCVDNGGSQQSVDTLTVGLTYIVKRMILAAGQRSYHFIDIVNDQGKPSNYYTWRFQLVDQIGASDNDAYEAIIEAQDVFESTIGAVAPPSRNKNHEALRCR
jgi:hypothetical protein